MKEYLDLNDYELMYMISENDEDAKQIMFKKYQPIVYKFAKKYYQIGKNYGLELDDVIQEGYVGLYIAINNYKEDKNCLFYTYASITIASKLKNLIKTHSTNKHLALNNYISLNSYVDNEECDSELVDFIEDSKEVLPDVEAEIQDFYNKIKDDMFSLPFKQGLILELKINGFNNTEIARLLDICVPTVASTMRKIRNRLYTLKNYF